MPDAILYEQFIIDVEAIIAEYKTGVLFAEDVFNAIVAKVVITAEREAGHEPGSIIES